MPTQRGLRALTLILIGVLATACNGISITIGSSANGAGGAQAEEEKTYRGPITRLVLDSDSGAVDLGAGPDGAVTVKQRPQWDRTKPEVTVAVDGDTLRVTARCPHENNRCQVDFTITLPAAAAVDATTGAGAVQAAGLAGDQRLVTSSGAVTAADLRAKTVDARATSGVVDLSFAQPPQSVTAESTAGGVEVTVPHDTTRYRVEAETVAGQRTVDVTTDAASEHTITARTTAGSVTVRYAG